MFNSDYFIHSVDHLCDRDKLKDMKVEEIVSDKELQEAFKNTDFGDSLARDVVKYSLLKAVSGFASGSTAKYIMVKLGLFKDDGKGKRLTKKGKEYLWAAFSEYYNHE